MNMRGYRASKQWLNEACDMGEDWATNSSRPQAMVTDLEDYAYYTTDEAAQLLYTEIGLANQLRQVH